MFFPTYFLMWFLHHFSVNFWSFLGLFCDYFWELFPIQFHEELMSILRTVLRVFREGVPVLLLVIKSSDMPKYLCFFEWNWGPRCLRRSVFQPKRFDQHIEKSVEKSLKINWCLVKIPSKNVIRTGLKIWSDFVLIFTQFLLDFGTILGAQISQNGQIKGT